MTFQKIVFILYTIFIASNFLCGMNQTYAEMLPIHQETTLIMPINEDGDYFKIETIHNKELLISCIKKNVISFKTNHDANKFLALKTSGHFTAITGIALGQRGCLIALAYANGSLEFYYWNVQKNNHNLVGMAKYPIRKVATPVGNIATKITSLTLRRQNILVTTNYRGDAWTIPLPEDLFSKILDLN